MKRQDYLQEWSKFFGNGEKSKKLMPKLKMRGNRMRKEEDIEMPKIRTINVNGEHFALHMEPKRFITDKEGKWYAVFSDGNKDHEAQEEVNVIKKDLGLAYVYVLCLVVQVD